MKTKITDVRFFKVKNGGSLVANINVCFNGELVVTGFKLCKGKKGGLWVAFPSEAYKVGRETKYADRAYFLDKDIKDEFTENIIKAWEENQ